MITPILPSSVRYSLQASDNGGYVVRENDEPIAYCTEYAYARAIVNALSLHRSAAAGKVLMLPAPVDIAEHAN